MDGLTTISTDNFSGGQAKLRAHSTSQNQEPIYKDNVLIDQEDLELISNLFFDCTKKQNTTIAKTGRRVANSFTPNLKEPCGDIFSELGIDKMEGFTHERN